MVSLLVAMGVGLVLISTSWVQSRILKKITQNFESTTQQKINFNKIRLQWNGKFEVSGIFIGDHHNDTLAYIDQIQTSINDLKRIQRSDFDLNELEATGVYLNIKKYPGEAYHSLNVLIRKLKRERTSTHPTTFHVNTFGLIHSSFRYADLNTEIEPIQFDSLNFNSTDLEFSKDSLHFSMNLLEGKLNSPYQEIIKTHASVFYAPGNLTLDDWEVTVGKNSLMGTLSLKGENNSFLEFTEKGLIDLTVSKSQLDLKSILNQQPWQSDLNILNAEFTASGTLNDFVVNALVLNHDAFSLKGQLIGHHILNQKERKWQLDLEEAILQTKPFIVKNKKLAGIKKYLEADRLQLNGSVQYSTDQIDFILNSKNRWGNISSQGSLQTGILDSEKAITGFVINSKLKSMKLLLAGLSDQKMNWGGDFELIGKQSPQMNLELNWKLNNFFIGTSNYLLSQIDLEGNYRNNQIRNTLGIDNERVGLKSDLLFDFSNTIPTYTLAANLTKWDLNHLGLRLGQGKREFRGVILGDFKGDRIDTMVGEVKISAARITNENTEVDLNPITISQRFIDGETELAIHNSDCISGMAKGTFTTSQLSKLFQQTLHEVYPFLPSKETEKNQSLTFNLKIYEKLLDALYPDFSISENISLKGTIGSNINNSIITLDAPLLRWDTAQLENLHFQIDTNNPIYNTFLSVDKLSHPYFKGKEFNMISTKLMDTLFFRSEFTKQAEDQKPFEVNFYHTLEAGVISHFGLKKSILPLGTDSWIVNPENLTNQKISYNVITRETEVSQLSALSDEQAIQLQGRFKDSTDYAVNVAVQKLKLDNIAQKNTTLNQRGEASLRLNVIRSEETNRLDLSARIADWTINDQEMGDFDLEANGNTLMNAYVVAFNLGKENKKSLFAKGVWQGWEDPTVNMNMSFDGFSLGFLSLLGKDAIQNIDGEITGDINVWGPIQQLKHNGILNLQHAQFSIPYLNVHYKAMPTNVLLSNQEFSFKSVSLYEEDEGTTASLEGTFSHVNFRDWSTQLNIQSPRMLLLNTPQLPESLFFGQGFLNGKLSLTGPTKNLSINLQGATEAGTSIKIPWAEDYGLSDSSFVQFVDKNNLGKQNKEDQEQQLKEISGLELNFELDVTNKASVEIVIDQETGSYLSGRGAGNLFMEINTNGKFNMWGDFITFDGVYNFKNLGVIDKKFNVKPGGTIVWEGNPLEAQMNLEAVYSVPGGANPALLLDNPNFNKSIPTEVLIRLQGNLLKPDDPVFEIDFPNTSGTVASEINYRLADPQRSQLQALSLLSQGIFINEVSVSMQGITNNLYQKASDIVSNLIGEENDKLKVGIDYLQGDKSALLDIATEDRLGFTLSTQISDRILLNGKIGVPVGGVEQTLIVGNVQIDFILNEEGSLRAKVFNKENEFRYIGDELGYTQGVGLSYAVDFNTFEELIQKIIHSQQQKSIIQDPIAADNAIQSEVQFISKN